MSSGERLALTACDPPERLRSGVQAIARAAPPHVDELPELTDDECEGAALSLLARVHAEQHPTTLSPIALSRALRLKLSPTVPSGCRGLLDLETWTLRFDGRGAPEQVSARVAHELGHLAAVLAGVRPPHSERSIDRIASALVMPRAAVRAAVRRVGFDPLRLLAELPGAPPEQVLVRAAWVAERAIVVLRGHARWSYAPDGAELPRAAAWERGLAAIVRQTGRPHRTLLGDEAWPVAFEHCEEVVIVLAE